MADKRNSEARRLAQLIKPRRKAYLLGLLGSSLMDSSMSLVFPLLIKLVLDAVTAKNMNTVGKICLEFSIIIALLICLTPLFQYLFGKTVKAIMIDFRLSVFHHMEKLPVAYYENTHSGDSLSRINNDLGVVENALSGNIRSIVSLLMTGVYSAVIMLFLNWKFAVVLILVGLVSTYVNSRFALPLRKISLEIQQGLGKQVERLMDLIAGAQVSRVFQMTGQMNRKYQVTNQLLAKLSIARSVRSAFLNSANYTLIWINNGGVFIFGTLLLIHGEITLGTLLSLILLLDHVTNLFRNLGSFWANLQSSFAGAARVFELLDIAEEPERHNNEAKNKAHKNESKQIIEFRNVSFSYGEGEKILDGLNLSIEKGHLVALVGPSGGGKSTILKLLLGFYPLEQGQIRFEGKRFTDYSLSEQRNKMAYVSQDSYLFEGTIEENIRYGRMDATYEEVVAAAKSAYAHDFIMEQSEGYSTSIGERGARLSGGQRQRITIARALLKNATILLLDEATSALDSESEQAVQMGLQRLMEGKTTITIAHRLSTIRQANMIYVIGKGRIMEQGRHADLLDAGGVYMRLHNMQDRKSK
ncbi:ABC transporter ATP-binding protein [Paenibacillus psychroresistens]|uniref:ABC transporter ATP-binding protein n=1 Tax=Paenibacillus psychroresistens TaxID=1778678 RepID=A0A6B8RDK6_9BACL|nr:ABC transporter ATP-binding protein [Paenibacillus psychroresistens]QGQ94220.1 ABC transporter ATP-binding protein [Paenibacillus psychroresistens]